MKLSEAILLGSTVVTPKAGALHFYGENAGCALGMAAIASGCTFSPAQRLIPVKDLRTVNVEDIWGPWLLRVVIPPAAVAPPSHCVACASKKSLRTCLTAAPALYRAGCASKTSLRTSSTNTSWARGIGLSISLWVGSKAGNSANSARTHS